MGSNKYAPLRIRAWLRSGVISDVWLPLDGALLYLRTREDLGAQEMSISGASKLAQIKGEVMIGGRLPIEIVHAKDWYYRCSWAQWGPCAEGRDAWSKRIDQTLAYLIDFRGRRGRVDTSAGAYKSYRMPIYYRAALWVEWYCWGDYDKLSQLCMMITHLGKKSVQGWGRVMRWQIDLIEEDWSIWRDGKLMRGIPKYHLPDNQHTRNAGIYGIRPPYWDIRNQMELELP